MVFGCYSCLLLSWPFFHNGSPCSNFVLQLDAALVISCCSSVGLFILNLLVGASCCRWCYSCTLLLLLPSETCFFYNMCPCWGLVFSLDAMLVVSCYFRRGISVHSESPSWDLVLSVGVGLAFSSYFCQGGICIRSFLAGALCTGCYYCHLALLLLLGFVDN